MLELSFTSSVSSLLDGDSSRLRFFLCYQLSCPCERLNFLTVPFPAERFQRMSGHLVGLLMRFTKLGRSHVDERFPSP